MNDPGMPFLSGALDVATAQAAFTKLDPTAQIREIRLLQHKPGRRAVIEYTLQGEDPNEVRVLIGKARAKGLDARGFAITNALSAEFETTEPASVRVPRPFGLLPEFNLWLQEKNSGTSATQVLLSDAAVAFAPRVAAAMHKLHRTHVPPPRTHSVEDELRILRERLAAVATMQPRWRERLEKLSAGCEQLARSWPRVEPSPIHRDFHPGQILAEPERLWLLDFDLFAWGDPAVDVGNFLAHVTELSVRHFGDEHRRRDVEGAIEDAYIRLAGASLRERIRGYAVLSLARHVFISTQFADRRQCTEALLSLAERRLAGE